MKIAQDQEFSQEKLVDSNIIEPKKKLQQLNNKFHCLKWGDTHDIFKIKTIPCSYRKNDNYKHFFATKANS